MQCLDFYTIILAEYIRLEHAGMRFYLIQGKYSTRFLNSNSYLSSFYQDGLHQ